MRRWRGRCCCMRLVGSGVFDLSDIADMCIKDEIRGPSTAAAKCAASGRDDDLTEVERRLLVEVRGLNESV
jgi:hypothetical protein